MAGETITLDFLAAQQRQLLGEMAAMRDELAHMRGDVADVRDDIRVLTAMAIRQDNSSKAAGDLLARFAERRSNLEKA